MYRFHGSNGIGSTYSNYKHCVFDIYGRPVMQQVYRGSPTQVCYTSYSSKAPLKLAKMPAHGVQVCLTEAQAPGTGGKVCFVSHNPSAAVVTTYYTPPVLTVPSIPETSAIQELFDKLTADTPSTISTSAQTTADNISAMFDSANTGTPWAPEVVNVPESWTPSIKKTEVVVADETANESWTPSIKKTEVVVADETANESSDKAEAKDADSNKNKLIVGGIVAAVVIGGVVAYSMSRKKK